MQQPLISVIVPCYNQAQYMDECLQSVLDQTYHNWECIIVNDGSPDHTEEVALQWTEKDTRFIYLKKENGGLSSARNAGIEIAKGEWILPLDCDDKIGSQYLELASAQFDKDYTIIYCEAEFFGDKEGKWKLPNFNFDNLLLFNHIYCSAFFKRSDWCKVNGYDLKLIYGREDWDFWLSILDKDSKVKKLNYDGFYYRRKDESMDTIINLDYKKIKFSEEYIFKKHILKYLDTDKNILETYKALKSNLLNYQRINKEINKNLLTRILYKIIEILN